jgi:hypothetical protein
LESLPLPYVRVGSEASQTALATAAKSTIKQRVKFVPLCKALHSGTYVQKRTMYSSAAMRPRCGRFTGIRGRLSSAQLDIVLADVGDRAGRVALLLDTRTRHRSQVRSVPNYGILDMVTALPGTA